MNQQNRPADSILDQLVNSFRTLMREQKADQLSNWMERYRQVEFDHIQNHGDGSRDSLWNESYPNSNQRRPGELNHFMISSPGFSVFHVIMKSAEPSP